RTGACLPVDSAMDGAFRRAAHQLAAAANLLRRHADSVADRLDVAGTAVTRAGAGITADRLHHGRAAGRCWRCADYLPPPHPGLHRADYRGGDSGAALDDPCRNIAELSGAGAARAADKLGCAA